MKNAVAIGLAALVGVLTGAGLLYLWPAKRNPEIGRAYSVRDIVDYRSNYDGNVMARLEVYITGEDGHAKTVTCLFPPDTKITAVEGPVAESPENSEYVPRYESFGFESWQGVAKFKIVALAEHLERDLYYCEPLL